MDGFDFFKVNLKYKSPPAKAAMTQITFPNGGFKPV